ncbi:MAG: hypothetical protein ACOY93_14220 [Bacillota bacterium]
MVRRWVVLMIPALLLGAVLWVMGIRPTPESAVRISFHARGSVVQRVPFPGGEAVLLREGGDYVAGSACRWALLLWRACGLSSIEGTEEGPVAEAAYWSADGEKGWGISLFAGLVRDEQIAAIRWGDQQQQVAGGRHFLFARRTPHAEAFPRAVALGESGQPLYEWGSETMHNWQPLLPERSEARGPADWFVPVPRDRGDWSASGSRPSEVARQFALGRGGECGCTRLTVTGIRWTEERQTYRVHLEGLRDDSLAGIEYLVEVERDGETWLVDSAAYRTECRRGASPEGLCL